MYPIDDLTDKELRVAEKIAQALASSQVRINRKSNGLETELKSVVSYLSSRKVQANKSVDLYKYLDAMIEHSEMIASEIDKNSDQRRNSPKYYRNIKKACENYIDLNAHNPTQVVRILGWTARLIRYYKTKGQTEDIQHDHRLRTENDSPRTMEPPVPKALQRP